MPNFPKSILKHTIGALYFILHKDSRGSEKYKKTKSYKKCRKMHEKHKDYYKIYSLF